ncbi:DUF262 domain-containing protein [Kribbella sp. NPDC051770]|uniref:DUF262 domain-containing protein n=1 Tax=Kribbella sp. NPDC051770 TaxID=3155413 RepID=UPI0034363A86
MAGSIPLDGSGAGSFTIPEIVELAGDGSVRVPTFQRHFAWRAQDIRRLFDSIYRGFPIGTLLLWRHEAEAGKISLGPIDIEVDNRSDAYWVVDGQQRITSLFAALSPSHKSNDETFEIYFDLETQQFISQRGGVVPNRAIPVREALETRSLLQWLRRHVDELEPDDFDLADRLGGAIRDYRIPAYIVTGDNQDLLREVFDRVNSAGKPISRAEVFHALFAGGEEPNSPATVSASLSKLGFGSIDEGRIVQTLLAIRGGDVQRDIRTEFKTSEKPSDWFDYAEVALTRAIRFLREEGVPHLLMMPNTLPLPVLAAYFHLHPEPQPWNRRLLARWLWRGWVHGFGREGGQTPVLRRAIRSVNPELYSPNAAPSEYDALKALLEYTPDREAPRLPLEGFNTKYANPRLILLALASLNPLDENEKQVNIAREIEKYGTEAVTQLIPGIRSNAAARSFWPVDSTPITRVRSARILDSHLIDEASYTALQVDNHPLFLKKRGEALSELSYKFLDSRLEPGGIIRPPLRQISTDGAHEDRA